MLEIRNIKKCFSDRKLLEIESFKIYYGDRIGIVGKNGVGKSTLLKIIYGEDTEYSGKIIRNGKISYLSQMGKSNDENIDKKISNKFSTGSIWEYYMSGGEQMKFKIAKVLSERPDLFLLDEPTNNLDIESIGILEEELKKFKGSMLIVSHNRDFLNKFCNIIVEVKGGSLKAYKGNYDYYIKKKEEEKDREKFEYEKYISDKNRLEKASVEIMERSTSMKKVPKRMGNSEARLHKMGNQKAKYSIDKSSKNIQKRIEKLEVKGKPENENIIKIGVQKSNDIFSKILIKGKNLSISFEDRIILKNTNFQIKNGDKVAIIGRNGSGKTTLLKSILEKRNNIEISSKLKIAYFSQNMDIVDKEKSIFENVKDGSLYDENFIRVFLARLLFKGDDILKKANILSGGELVKLSLAKILLEDSNILVLDEPTNNLDIESLEVVEQVIKDYNGTVLLVSHDKKITDYVCNKLLIIEDKKIIEFNGNYSDYILKKEIRNDRDSLDQKLILENKLSEIISKISISQNKEEVEVLDKKYNELIKELNELRKKF